MAYDFSKFNFIFNLEKFNEKREGYNLIFPYYEPDDKLRVNEINFCLRKNIENELIKTIFLFISETDKEKITIPINEKIIEVIIETDRVYFDQIIKFAQSFKNQFFILVNSDIFLDNTISEIDLSDKNVYCLSRHEYINESTIKIPVYHRRGSQDCWIFRSDIEINNFEELDFRMGVPGCDSRIAYIFYENGYKVLNTSLTTKIYHVHNNNYRTYHGIKPIKGKHLLIDVSVKGKEPNYSIQTIY